MQYNLQFHKLCERLYLGELLSKPVQLSGGLIHRMYAIETVSGKYAIKALNPQVMLRPNAMTDIVNGERIAAVAASYIPALPAKQLNNSFVHEICGQYYLVYDWINGQSQFNENITPSHCARIGEILGNLHSINFSHLDIPRPAVTTESIVDWDGYLLTGQQNSAPWVSALSGIANDIYNWNHRYLVSMKYLESPLVIGHGDIDPKNVLWCDGNPVVIDWESAGFLNPFHELIIYALYWSDQNGVIEKNKFEAFFNGYQSHVKLEKVDWRVVMDAGLSLHWLEYNIKRSLGIDCTDFAEQKMGTEQVYGTIEYLRRYEATIPQILMWLT